MIEIRNCSKAFGEIHAIDHVLMEIGERQIFGLVGTNGAGKSTLLRMAAGVIKPDEGEILVDQEPVYENEKIKQQIFYISDGGYFPQGYTAADLKDFYREYYPDFMTDRYSKLMDQFHLDEKRRISSYSKGMKKTASGHYGNQCRDKISVMRMKRSMDLIRSCAGSKESVCV